MSVTIGLIMGVSLGIEAVWDADVNEVYESGLIVNVDLLMIRLTFFF